MENLDDQDCRRGSLQCSYCQNLRWALLPDLTPQLTDNAGMEEKVRVSKLLSELGLCSRREADSYIEQGLVTVDGEVVNELGVRAFRHQKLNCNLALKHNKLLALP